MIKIYAYKRIIGSFESAYKRYSINNIAQNNIVYLALISAKSAHYLARLFINNRKKSLIVIIALKAIIWKSLLNDEKAFKAFDLSFIKFETGITIFS